MNAPDPAAVKLAEDRIAVASEKGLPSGFASRLRGSTRAELEADADALAPYAGSGPSSKTSAVSVSDRIRAAVGRQQPKPASDKPTGGEPAHAEINRTIREAAGR